jgi:hypothetical protein
MGGGRCLRPPTSARSRPFRFAASLMPRSEFPSRCWLKANKFLKRKSTKDEEIPGLERLNTKATTAGNLISCQEIPRNTQFLLYDVDNYHNLRNSTHVRNVIPLP